jgi:hypothetical protein
MININHSHGHIRIYRGENDVLATVSIDENGNASISWFSSSSRTSNRDEVGYAIEALQAAQFIANRVHYYHDTAEQAVAAWESEDEEIQEVDF